MPKSKRKIINDEPIALDPHKSVPVIVEPAVAPMIYADSVIIEVKPDVVWAHICTRHDFPNGSYELHRQAIIVLTPHAFAASLKAANLAAFRIVDGEADH